MEILAKNFSGQFVVSLSKRWREVMPTTAFHVFALGKIQFKPRGYELFIITIVSAI